MQFSIIVPVYNAEKTVRNCIDSILNQTHSQFELLLIDDGSKDTSGKICDEYALHDKRVRVFHQENHGVSDARNVGITAVQNDWILFADADDTVNPEWISKFDSAIASKDKDATNYLFVQDAFFCSAGNLSRLLYDDIVFNRIESFLSYTSWGYLWNKCFSANRIKTNCIRFDTEISVFEDELFVAAYCNEGTILEQIKYAGYNYSIPDNFEKKYKEVFPISLTAYSRMRICNRVFAENIVDRLVVNGIEYAKSNKSARSTVVNDLFNYVGRDIGYVRGAKKYPLRLLSHVQILEVWSIVFNAYFCLPIV